MLCRVSVKSVNATVELLFEVQWRPEVSAESSTHRPVTYTILLAATANDAWILNFLEDENRFFLLRAMGPGLPLPS